MFTEAGLAVLTRSAAQRILDLSVDNKESETLSRRAWVAVPVSCFIFGCSTFCFITATMQADDFLYTTMGTKPSLLGNVLRRSEHPETLTLAQTPSE